MLLSAPASTPTLLQKIIPKKYATWLFPWLMPEFGLSFTGIGTTMTVFFIVSGVGQAAAGFLVDRFGAVRVLAAEANRLRREDRLVEHLQKSGVLHADRLGRTAPTWIRAAEHSRESARFVASGKHFFDTPQAAVA